MRPKEHRDSGQNDFFGARNDRAGVDVAGVVDVQNDRRRLALVGCYPLIDERVGQADRILQGRRVLQPRQRRLRTQVCAGLGQPPARELECGVGAQAIQIVSVLVAAGDGESAGPDHVGEPVRDPRGIAAI